VAKAEKQKRWHSISMPKQKPKDRIRNFNEVALGYTMEQAVAKSERKEQPTRNLWSSLSTGNSMPKVLHSGKKRRSIVYWETGTVCS
jgi:hypothetical protein